MEKQRFACGDKSRTRCEGKGEMRVSPLAAHDETVSGFGRNDAPLQAFGVVRDGETQQQVLRLRRRMTTKKQVQGQVQKQGQVRKQRQLRLQLQRQRQRQLAIATAIAIAIATMTARARTTARQRNYMCGGG